MKRIAIVDWDVHAGDGTYDLVKADKDVLFFSLHQYDDGSFYPIGRNDINLIGEGEGFGKKIQIGWNTFEQVGVTAGNNEYVYAFEGLILPILREFQPEFILVSCGFDSANNDLLGGCELEADGYAYMTKRLIEIQPRISLVLEGGYYPPQL